MRYRFNRRYGFERRYRFNIKKIILGVLIAVIMLCLLFCKGKEPEEQVEDIKTKITTISKVEVFNHRENKVETMDMDEYMICVVAAEMPASFEPQALKAQAVCARTYTIYKAGKNGCNATKKMPMSAQILVTARHTLQLKI